MSKQTTNQKLEIQTGWMDDSDGHLPEGEALQLLVANLVDDVPIKHCCGVMISASDPLKPEYIDPAPRVKANHFEAVLKGGNFVIEIPNESFHSELIVAKLLKAEPEQRMQLLAQIMREIGVSRILLITPAKSSMIQESLPW